MKNYLIGIIGILIAGFLSLCIVIGVSNDKEGCYEKNNNCGCCCNEDDD